MSVLQTIDEAYVRAAAAAVDLPIPSERLSAVVDTLQRIAVLAQPLAEVGLDHDDEIAPLWRP